MTLLDHARQQERDDAAASHEKDAKHGLLVQKKPPSLRRCHHCGTPHAHLATRAKCRYVDVTSELGQSAIR